MPLEPIEPGKFIRPGSSLEPFYTFIPSIPRSLLILANPCKPGVPDGLGGPITTSPVGIFCIMGPQGTPDSPGTLGLQASL